MNSVSRGAVRPCKGIWQLGKESVEREDKHVSTGLTEAGESEGLLGPFGWSVRLCVSERHARHRSFDSLVD